ncbi:PucR family transcriptional regulator [Herbiconiux sp. YIM B11900]|uniref:PucR family transcriptional regulator n=1 Tax=Herbiconiux sp. YIM B11900 TaxID=3404131 RepID=UPI003F874AF0
MSADEGRWPLLLRLSRGLAGEKPDLAKRMADRIRADVPFYRSEAHISVEAINQSTREHIEALVNYASAPDGPDTAPRALGERRARDGTELADVLDALQVSTSFLWDEIVEYARRTTSATDTELVDLASEIWTMHDSYVRNLTTGYREEYSRVLLSRQQERLGLVYGLLTARGREAASPWDAVDRLGFSRTEGFVVVAATTATAGRLSLPRVEQTLAAAGVASAWVMVADVQLGIVSSAADSWLELVTAEALTWGSTAGVSPVMPTFTSIGLAVRLARIARATASPGNVVAFDDSPVAMAAAGSPDVTERIVDTVLGGLSAISESDRTVIVETLAAFFDSDGSVADVASLLAVHENTVRNRLSRVRTITGRDPMRPRDAAELLLALSGRGIVM